jgi:hypothetical protein
VTTMTERTASAESRYTAIWLAATMSDAPMGGTTLAVSRWRCGLRTMMRIGIVLSAGKTLRSKLEKLIKLGNDSLSHLRICE